MEFNIALVRVVGNCDFCTENKNDYVFVIDGEKVCKTCFDLLKGEPYEI